MGGGLVRESFCFGGDAAEMALLVSREVAVTAGAMAGEGFGGRVDMGGRLFVVGSGSGEGEEVVGDDALRLVVGGRLAVWVAVSELRCLTGFRVFGGGRWFIREAVVGCGSLLAFSFVFNHRLCCTFSENSFAMWMPPHLLSACSRGVQVMLKVFRPIVNVIRGPWESAVRARAPSLKIIVRCLLRAWRTTRFGVSVAGCQSFESVVARIEHREGFGGFSWVGETAEGDQCLGQGLRRGCRMYVDEVAEVGCGLFGRGHDWW